MTCTLCWMFDCVTEEWVAGYVECLIGLLKNELRVCWRINCYAEKRVTDGGTLQYIMLKNTVYMPVSC